jgi:hypothetical protein
MKSPHPGRRRIVRDFARAGTAVAAVMLALSMVWPLFSGGQTAYAAPINGGVVHVLTPSASGVGAPLDHGNFDTPFVLELPVSSKCSGDSVAGYRATSYIVPGTVDPSTLTFGAVGPIPPGYDVNLRQPLYDRFGTAWVVQTVGLGDGLVYTGTLPEFSFEGYGAGGSTYIPAGTYNLGIACTGPTPSALDKYWNVRFTFAADFSWVVAAAAAPTTTTTTTTTTTLVSTGSSTTTTTTPGATSTTTTSTSTTTTTPGSTTTTRAIASLASSSGGSGSLAGTGWPSTWVVFWAVLLIVFGRMAVLLGRAPAVRPDSDS